MLLCPVSISLFVVKNLKYVILLQYFFIGKPSERCPPGQVFNRCGNPCHNECPQSDRVCPMVCVPGCYCPPGMMLVNGDCVSKEDQCKNVEECSGELVYSDCGSACANFCPDSEKICPAVCVEGCFCAPGKMQVNGTCVTQSEYCKKDDCWAGKVYEECGNPCDYMCPNEERVCPAACRPGWYCPRGTMEVNGSCVSMEEHCQIPKCRSNESWRLGNDCTDACPKETTILQCEGIQFEGCFCDEGFKRIKNECVPEENCFNCTGELDFFICGTLCNNLCSGSLEECPSKCQPGCYCLEGMIEVGERCIGKEEFCN